MTNSRIIVIEGGDRQLRDAQVKLLEKRLSGQNLNTHTLTLDTSSSEYLKKYQSGNYGKTVDIGPYTPSLMFALEAFNQIRTAPKCEVLIINGYLLNVMSAQAMLLANENERLGYYTWISQIQDGVFKLPKPEVHFVLMDGSKSDTESRSTLSEMSSLFAGKYTVVNCQKDNQLLSVPNISNILWEKLEPMLPKKSQQPAKKPEDTKPENKPVQKKNNPFLSRDENGAYSITKKGREYLKDAVTNTDKNVYAFTDKLPNATVAAAMARLSRRGDDMRVTILDEFASQQGKDEDLLNRVITAYGDDSVQQLAGVHVVVENASNLLTKKLEWGRLASYLEQSTRYIYFDQKDSRGNYKYFTPKNLDADTAKEYEQTLDEIFKTYSEMVRQLTGYVRNNSSTPESEKDVAWKGATRAQACDAVRHVLPVATKSTVGIFASGQAIESLIMHLQSDELQEAQDNGKYILNESRKVIPVFLERADRPDRGGATVAYRSNTYSAMKKLSEDKLPANLAAETEPVTLLSYWPKNELDLLSHMLYEHSSLPIKEIEKEIFEWSYEDKVKSYKTYFGERLNRRHKPGRALEQAHYTFDIVCDYGIFRDLQRHRMVDDLQWQELTPRYGYDMPELVDKAGLGDLYEKCFDLSFQLYSKMQAAGYQLEAQYATLLGHKMRWKVTLNARSAFHLIELRTAPQGHPGYRKLAKQIYDQIASVHPLLAEQMIFINKDEDPELTRLAAERYTQFKLKQMG